MCSGKTFKGNEFGWATGLFSPEWIKDHKKELLAALAIGGAAYTGGASLGLLGGTAGAAAGAGAAAEGGSLLGGLGAAELGAAGAGEGAAGAYASAAGGEAATPFFSQTMLDGLGTGLDRFGRIAQLSQRAGLGQQQRPPMAPPMGVQPLQTQSGIPPLSQTFPTNIVDDERKRRLLLMQQRGY